MMQIFRLTVKVGTNQLIETKVRNTLSEKFFHTVSEIFH